MFVTCCTYISCTVRVQAQTLIHSSLSCSQAHTPNETERKQFQFSLAKLHNIYLVSQSRQKLQELWKCLCVCVCPKRRPIETCCSVDMNNDKSASLTFCRQTTNDQMCASKWYCRRIQKVRRAHKWIRWWNIID